MGKFTETELVEILNKYGTLSDEGEASILDKTLTSTDKKHEIKVSEIWNVPFEDAMVKFNISGLNYTSYNGDYEVENGTTWEEFINTTFPDNYVWMCIKSTGFIFSNVDDGGPYQIVYEYLCDPNGSGVKKGDKIIKR